MRLKLILGYVRVVSGEKVPLIIKTHNRLGKNTTASKPVRSIVQLTKNRDYEQVVDR